MDYFRVTPWYHWTWVLVLVGTLTAGVFFPEAIPYDLLGPLGRFLYYMNYSQQTLLRLILFFTVVGHVGEGAYAYILTRRMNMTSRCTFLWTAQTTIVGFTSLMPLRAKSLQLQKEE